MANSFKDKIKDVWYSLSRKSGEDAISGIGREKIIVFGVALVLASSLWLIVNLNREYSIDIQVPIILGNITADQALVEELPAKVTASVNGDGWSLINIYQTPPQIYIDVSDREVNLFEQVRQQMSTVSNVSVQTVEPFYFQLNLEEKRSKTVPVVSNVSIDFADQYGFLGDPTFIPDSITVSGAASRIKNIEQWPTKPLKLQKVKTSVSTEIGLKESTSLIILSQQQVQYRADVAQFTEAEVTVPVEKRDFPAGLNVTFSPSRTTIKYRIPLEEYGKFKNSRPFAAYVAYPQIEQDTSGFVKLQVDTLVEEAHLNVRTVEPQRVGYFIIIGN